MTTILDLCEVSARVPDGRGERVLLDRVDLSLAQGTITAITGRSGSGKSTLLSIAGLLRRPPSGDVVLSGRPTSGLRERRRVQLRGEQIGIVYQNANLIPNLTAIEQIELVGHILGRRQGATKRAQSLLDDLGVGAQAHSLPGQLSGGERQRVGIARALMAGPVVLLADEPTASLDPKLAAQVSELLVEYTRTRGLATMIVTHDATPLRRADVHLELRDGKLMSVPLVVPG